MSEAALFNLDVNGNIVAPRPLWPCGRHERFGRGELDHIAECMSLRCTWCGKVERNALKFEEVHGVPSGYSSGYCLAQRYAWERRAECVGCHSTLWSSDGCRNSACRLFAADAEPGPAARDWTVWFEGCAAGVHRLAACGHCERCGGALLGIIDELTSRCTGHPEKASPLRG